MKCLLRINPDLKLLDIGTRFNISKGYAGRVLKKLGYSYKKSFAYLEANKEKRERYLEQIKEIPQEKLVYFHESGIEMNICKDRG